MLLSCIWLVACAPPSPEELSADLFSAAEAGDAGEIRSLLTDGADPNTTRAMASGAVESPLAVAAVRGHVEAVRALLEGGALNAALAGSSSGGGTRLSSTVLARVQGVRYFLSQDSNLLGGPTPAEQVREQYQLGDVTDEAYDEIERLLLEAR